MGQSVVTEYTTILILEKNYADTIRHFIQFWPKFFHAEICPLIGVTETKTTQGPFV